MSVPLVGMETEYGIIREDMENSDPVEESMKLLQAYERKSVSGKWAYSQENSHLDMRGFKVGSLAQDEEEDAFCAEDRKRPYSYLDMKCDRVLATTSFPVFFWPKRPRGCPESLEAQVLGLRATCARKHTPYAQPVLCHKCLACKLGLHEAGQIKLALASRAV